MALISERGQNGMGFLQQYGLRGPNTVRLNPFMKSMIEQRGANDESPRDVPVDMTALCRGLIENYSVTSIDLHRCGVSPDGAYALSQVIASTKFLADITLSRNRFGTKGAMHLAEALKVNQTVRHLNLAWNDLRNDFAGAIAEALTMNNSLQSLHLDRNLISEDGAGAIAVALTSNYKLKYLGLSHNRIGAAGCGILGEGLMRCKNLLTLDLSMNGIATEGIFSLAAALCGTQSMSALQTLNLSYNKVGSSIIMLGDYIARTSSLRELNLEFCYLESGKELQGFSAQMKQPNVALCNVSFARNRLGSEGIKTLGEGLKAIKSLRFIDFTEVGLHGDAIESILLPMTESCGKLSTLHLSENDLGGYEEAIGKLAFCNPSLSFLGLQYCHLHNSEKLVKSFQQHQRPACGPTGLNLRHNELDDDGLQKLARWLSSYSRLSYLDLGENNLTSLHRDLFYDVFDSNKKLPYVVFENTTVITPERLLHTEWDGSMGSLPPDDTIPFPPLCKATIDLDSSGRAPTVGFSTYSITVGSAMKRQFERIDPFPTSALFLLAGKPVKHLSTYAPAYEAKVAPFGNQEARIDALTAADEGQLFEQNIGSLLLSEDQLRREFNRLDVNGNGYLDKEEFKGVLQTFEDYGAPLSDRQLEWLISKYSGEDRRLSYEEFCAVFLKIAQF